MQSFIVWMMFGIAEKKTARKGMREPSGDGDNFGDFRCVDHEDGSVLCKPSVVIKSDSESLAGIPESDSHDQDSEIDYAYVTQAHRVFPTPEFPMIMTLTSP
jgi:hypothetical protein